MNDMGATLLALNGLLTGERTMTKHTGGRTRPTRDEIAHLAYRFYELRGREAGRDLEDWVEAERQLIHHYR